MSSIYDSIIFDLDGTIFQTDKLAIPAFENTFKQLENEGYAIEYKPTYDEMLSVIGLTLDDIWQNLLPDHSKEVYIKASKYLLENELNGIKGGYGALYPNVVETLLELKSRGYRLFIASNGLQEYVQEVLKGFRINILFEAIYSAGEFNTTSKKDLVCKLIKDYNIKNAIIVGDRLSDVEAGKSNQLFVIGCAFGFSINNELKDADKIINKFSQITDIITKD